MRRRSVGAVYRGEDAGDLEKNEFDVLVENWTCLNSPRRKIFKSNLKILRDEKSWKTWKSIQKIVIDEELVHGVVMGAKIREELCDGCQN